jgi:lipopolysaccharide transport system ATP-binding protein
MSDIPIRAEKLGKKYVLAHQAKKGHRGYSTLRDTLTEAVTAPFRRIVRRKELGASEEQTAESGSSSNPVGREEFWALKDVSFQIKRGESVGIIGRNGAGKSTLLKLLSRITEPTTGRIELDGNVASLLEVGTGFHPELTGRENIYLNGAVLGMKRAEIKRKFNEIVAFAEVEKFLDTPVKHYSSGMYVRLAFAVAAHLEPDILIVDEVLAVGDAEFQKKCLGKMQSVSEDEGRTVIFVSHNMQAIRQMCQRVIFLKQGKIDYSGDPHTAISAYLGQGVDAEAHATIELGDYPRVHARDGAELTRVRFINDRGQPATSVGLKDTLGIEVGFRTKKMVRQFNLAMAMIHGEGLRVFSEAYSDEHPLPDLAQGEYILLFHIPMRFFKMESYFLSLCITENGKFCDAVDGLLMPEIVEENPNLQMESQRWGVVRIPITWDEIKPAQAKAATEGARS